MIFGSVKESLQGLIDKLRGAAKADLGDLSREIARIVEEENAAGLLAGLDAAGSPMAEVKESTIRRGRGGFGPPTVPRFGGSQLIDRFRVNVEREGSGYRVFGSWPGVRQVKYLATGTRHMPARNPIGLRPAARQRIESATRNAAINFFGRA